MKKLVLFVAALMFSIPSWSEGIVCITNHEVLFYDIEKKTYSKLSRIQELKPNATKIHITFRNNDSVIFLLYNPNTIYPDNYSFTKWKHYEYFFIYTNGWCRPIAYNCFHKEGSSIVYQRISLDSNYDGSTDLIVSSSSLEDRYKNLPQYNKYWEKKDSSLIYNIYGTWYDVDSSNCMVLHYGGQCKKIFCGQAYSWSSKNKVKSKYQLTQIRPQQDFALVTHTVSKYSEKNVTEYLIMEIDLTTTEIKKTWTRYVGMSYSFSGKYIVAKKKGRFRIIKREQDYSETLLRKDVVCAFWI